MYGRKNQFSGSFGVIENRLGKVEGRVRFDPHGTQTKTEWELLGSSVCSGKFYSCHCSGWICFLPDKSAAVAYALKVVHWAQAPVAVSSGELPRRSGHVSLLNIASLNAQISTCRWRRSLQDTTSEWISPADHHHTKKSNVFAFPWAFLGGMKVLMNLSWQR